MRPQTSAWKAAQEATTMDPNPTPTDAGAGRWEYSEAYAAFYRDRHVHVEEAEVADYLNALEQRLAIIAAHNGGLVQALRKIAYDENTTYLACSDLPYCGGTDDGEHADDCAVGIARAALTALEQAQ